MLPAAGASFDIRVITFRIMAVIPVSGRILLLYRCLLLNIDLLLRHGIAITAVPAVIRVTVAIAVIRITKTETVIAKTIA